MLVGAEHEPVTRRLRGRKMPVLCLFARAVLLRRAYTRTRSLCSHVFATPRAARRQGLKVTPTHVWAPHGDFIRASNSRFLLPFPSHLVPNYHVGQGDLHETLRGPEARHLRPAQEVRNTNCSPLIALTRRVAPRVKIFQQEVRDIIPLSSMGTPHSPPRSTTPRTSSSPSSTRSTCTARRSSSAATAASSRPRRYRRSSRSAPRTASRSSSSGRRASCPRPPRRT